MGNIAIIGAGNVGKTLGDRFKQVGHTVVFGVRNPADPKFQGYPVKSVADAIRESDIIFFTVPYSALASTAKEFGDFGDRVLVDCTNPINSTFDGLLNLETSAGEELAAISGSKFVVKAFNTIGFNVMADPSFGDLKATLLYCGDNGDAKSAVAKLAAEIGFSPIDAGPLLQAKWLEAQAWLWISMALKFGYGREIAFTFNRR